jgi:hypothetical protein
MNLRARVVRPPPRYSTILWLIAAIVANAALPRTLARAARSAAARDEEDCRLSGPSAAPLNPFLAETPAVTAQTAPGLW